MAVTDDPLLALVRITVLADVGGVTVAPVAVTVVSAMTAPSETTRQVPRVRIDLRSIRIILSLFGTGSQLKELQRTYTADRSFSMRRRTESDISRFRRPLAAPAGRFCCTDGQGYRRSASWSGVDPGHGHGCADGTGNKESTHPTAAGGKQPQQGTGKQGYLPEVSTRRQRYRDFRLPVRGLRPRSEGWLGGKAVVGRKEADRFPPGQSRLDGRSQAFRLGRFTGFGPVLEFGHDLTGEELE